MRRDRKDYLNRLYHYSIRKTSLGVGSVVVGLFLSGVLPQEVVLAETPLTAPAVGQQGESPGVQLQEESTRDLPNQQSSGTEVTTELSPTARETANQPVSDQSQAVSDDADTSRSAEVTQSESPAEWHKVNHYNETDKTVNFDNDWKFNLGDSAGASAKSFDDSSWKKLDLPHDFSLTQDYTPSGEAESGYKPGGTGWYRKAFSIGEEAAKGRVNLQFDGAYMETEVFINGTSLGTHTYGYSPFSFDLTKHLKKDEENVLAIKVTNPIPSSRWYSGSGIYRSVNLNFAPSVHLAEYGVVATTPDLKDTHHQDSGSRVAVKTTVVNQGEETAEVTVRSTLFERDSNGQRGNQVAVSAEVPAQSLAKNQSSAIATELTVVRPQLWSVANPNLYILRTEVLKNGTVVQTNEQEMGFRYTEFDKDTGFKLNGEKMKLQGVSMHHDQGALGARAYYDAIERQFTILKDMGVNAVRVTHNPASRAMKDIANRKGMLLIDEAFDTWEHAKNGNSNDYARYFNRVIGDSVRDLNGASAEQTWAEYHIKQMVKSGINDPSIIMWSTGNEVMEGFTANISNYPEVISKLIRWVNEVDPTRPATFGDNKLKDRNNPSSQITTAAVGMAEALSNATVKGIVGYNYANGAQYDRAKELNPNWIIYGSETASAVNSRGVYNVKGNTQRADRQLTSYDQSTVNWGHVASEAWYDVVKRDFVAGEFVWTGFDYLGEPTPWNKTNPGANGAWGSPKSSYFGIVDTAGLPKDSYYFYRSQWQKGDTTLHVLPAWHESVVQKDNQNRVEVVVYSNAAKVKLVHIGTDGVEREIGTKAFTKETTDAGYTYQIYKGDDKHGQEHKNLYLTWQVPYQPGTIKAIALDENGREITKTVGNSEVKTFTAATKLNATVTHKKEVVDNHNLAYVTIDIQDASGNLVANATNRITVNVTGEAELVAMDNGNPVDHQSYQENNRQAFGGKVVAILKMTGKTGNVSVTATADGLAESTQTFAVTGKHIANPDKVDSYNLTKTIYVKKGAPLRLPDKTLVRYEGGRTEEKDLTFNRSMIDQKLATGETFTASGTIAGLTTKAEVVVAVIDQIAAIKNISTATEVGTVPKLPETVQAYLADGSLLSATFPVSWQMPEAVQFGQAGKIVINGTADVLGQQLPVTASVRVADKTILIDQNVAPSARTLTQNITGSDTLEAIRNGSWDVSANNQGGPNPTIWSNWQAAQNGQKTATLSFTYDTAQTIAEVVAYYHRDRLSLRNPKSATFAWNRGSGAPDEVIAATATSEAVTGTSLTKVTYRLARPVSAVEFKMTVENSDEEMPSSQKSSVGIAELQLMTALERFNTESETSLNEVRVGDRTYTGNQVGTTMRVPAGGAVAARHTDRNVAVTILPEKDNVVKIFTQSEDGSRTATYTINLVPESPSTPVDKRYVPRNEVQLSAGSTENRASEAVTNANDFNLSTHWHSVWGAGTDIANLWLTADTGRVRQLDGIAYMQRQDGSPNGKVSNYEVYVSTDNQAWERVATGAFADNNDWQEVSFSPKQARYVRLKAVNTLGASPNRFMSVSEFRARESLDPNATITLIDGNVSLPTNQVTHTGQALTPKPVVTVGGQTLAEHTDYTLSYSDNVGQATSRTTATVTITGTGRYQGTVNKTFTILPSQVTEVVSDGTVELPDSWTASTTTDVTDALTDPAYLNKTYTVFPTPQKVTYGDGLVRLDGTVNLVIGNGVDIYTRNRLKSTLQANNISYTTSRAAVEGSANIFLGIHGQDTLAGQHQATAGIAADLYGKIDAHSLVIKDGKISVVGKDTDAVFHGLTTLKHMLTDSEKPVLRHVTVEDYADIKNRGFIEGYYGNPWSNADRAELMRYGGDLKMTQYFFAPKDDEYHNSRWRELYPNEKLEEIRELAKAGNQSKTRYVWTLHPFMHNAVRFDSNYQTDLEVIKAKFTQLLNVGVREFGILADDARATSADNYNRLMHDLTDWLGQQQSNYTGLRKDMIFVPANYWGNGTSAELRGLNAGLPATSDMVLTGGRIWGEVSTSFLNSLKTNLEANGQSYRPIQLWINWPCTDNSKNHLILGGGEKFLHPNVDPSLIAGIMLNPMQQSEPSKIALFSAAEYTWKVWKSEAEAQRVNDMAFNFAENGTFKDSETSRAFRELGKHMINQNMDSRVVKLEESLELAPKLTAFLNKLDAGQNLAASRDELRQEFAKLKTAAETYKASGNALMKAQISYWLDNTIDQMDALDKLLTATEHLNGDRTELWNNYKAGLDKYNQSKTHTFWYVNHYEAAELGVQHIRPFILTLLERVSGEIEQALDPSLVQTSLITNRTFTGDLGSITDGKLTTQLLSQNPAAIAEGDYVGLAFSRPQAINRLALALGRNGNLNDTFARADVQYLNENDEWVKLDSINYVGNESTLTFDGLDVTAKAVRIIATAAKANTWLGVREIAVNRPLEVTQNTNRVQGTLELSENLMYKYGTTQVQALDDSATSETMVANSNGQDNLPANSWVKLNLGNAQPLSKITIVQGANDKIKRGVVEYTEDGTIWHKLADVTTNDRTITINRDIVASAVRIRNDQAEPIWWRIADFKIESNQGVTDYTETSVPALADTRTHAGLDNYRMTLPAASVLKPADYLGLKLARLHQLADISLTGTANDQLSLLYSPNGVEWYRQDQLADQNLVRYVRLVNETDSDQVISAQALTVRTVEILPDSLVSTTLTPHGTYGEPDVRNRNNLHQLFDGDLNTYVEFSNFPRQGGDIVLKLGSERQVRKIRAYVQDGTVNYLRDGKIQVSADGQTWTDVVTVGDGQANSHRDDSLTDGWTHDSNRPGNRYIEGTLDTPATANYLRVLFTANYDHRFVGFTELVINDGEFVKTSNDPTAVTTGAETADSLATNMVDGRILTGFRANGGAGELTYRLSDKTTDNHVTILSTLADGQTVSVKARVVEEDVTSHDRSVATKWVDLGNLTTSFQTLFVPPTVKHLLEVKLVHGEQPLEVYEIATYSKPFTTQTRTEVEELDFDTEVVEDATLAKGEIRVDREGVKGSVTKTIEDTLSDEQLVSTRVIDTVRVEPTSKKVRVGTMEVTPPPADGTDTGTDAGNDGNTGNQDTGTDHNTGGDNTDNSGHSGNDTNTGNTDNQTDGGQDSGDGSGNTDTGNNTGDGQGADTGTGQGDQSETAPQPPADGGNPDVIDTPETPKPSEVVHQPTGVKVKVTSSQNADIAAKIAGASVAHKETGDSETPEVLKGKDFDIFDIELVDKDGQPLDWTGEAKVTLPIDAGKEVAEVFYLPENGQPEQLDFETKEVTDASGKTSKVVTFTAKHFSQYGIVYKSATVPTPSTPITPPTVIIDNSGVVDKGDQGTDTTGKANTTTPVVTPVAAASTSTVASSKPSLPATGDADSAIAVFGTVALISALGLAGVRRKGD